MRRGSRLLRTPHALLHAGYDAHHLDPLEQLQLQSATYHALAAAVLGLARELCGGRLLLVLEGGCAEGLLVAAVCSSSTPARIPRPLARLVGAGIIKPHWQSRFQKRCAHCWTCRLPPRCCRLASCPSQSQQVRWRQRCSTCARSIRCEGLAALLHSVDQAQAAERKWGVTSKRDKEIPAAEREGGNRAEQGQQQQRDKGIAGR